MTDRLTCLTAKIMQELLWESTRNGAPNVLNVILQAIKQEGSIENPHTQHLIAGWIRGGLVSDGSFMVTGISKVKFTFSSYQSMTFSASVGISLPPDYDKVATKTYQWGLKGNLHGSRYTGQIK